MSGKKIPKAVFSFGRFKKPTPNDSVPDKGFAFGGVRSVLRRKAESPNSVQRQTLDNGSPGAKDESE